MVINSNLGAAKSARLLSGSNVLLSKALQRLSSGSKIVSPDDDAAGLAQAFKLNSQVKRLDAALQNTANLISFHQTQDGYLTKVVKSLDRMSELAVLGKDGTKTANEIDLYKQEFDVLAGFIEETYNKKFNEVNLFSDTEMKVITGADGSTRSITAANLASAVGKGNGEYTINLEFTGGLSEDQRNLFYAAANRWQSIITADAADVGLIDDLDITVNASAIDGVGGVLANASISSIRGASPAPLEGVMNFDTSDLESMGNDGTLYSVILHEMGHVLGIGSRWSAEGLTSTGADGPVYTGQNAVDEYNEIFGTSFAALPVEDSGGAGTALVHPEEGDVARTIGGVNAPGLDNEVMTGSVEGAGTPMPLSTISIGFLDDLGYEVDYGEADSYSGAGTGSGPRVGPGFTNIENLKAAIQDVAQLRAIVGANIASALSYSEMLQVEKENLSQATSRIQDTNVATATTEFSRAQILVNSGTAMLSQANVLHQTVLQLLPV